MAYMLLTVQGGILKPFAWILGIILNGIYELVSLLGVHNIAICIVLFTIVIRMIMLPLTIKQQKFTKLSTKMNPELTAITEKYKGKKDEVSQRRMQAETQEVYQKYGATPFSGCLPLLITLPIMFALYRVIYKIPAYVTDIYAMYNQIADIISNFVKDMNGQGIISAAFENFSSAFKVTNATKYAQNIGKFTFGSDDFIKSVIDVLSCFNKNNWNDFVNGTLIESDSWKALLSTTSQTSSTWVAYLKETIGADYLTKIGELAGKKDGINELATLLNISNLGDSVALKDLAGSLYWNTFSLSTDIKAAFTNASGFAVIDDILDVNKFIGNMSILDSCGWKLPGILIPILAAATQFIQSKLTTVNNDQNKKKNEEESPIAQSMKGMTTFMPIMSGAICIALPVGVGLYWIIGTVVQIVQQIFINIYLDKTDVEDIIAKSVEKNNKRREKMGIKTDSGNVTSVAKTQTKSVDTNSVSSYSKAKTNNDYTRPEGATGKGGIADIANILKNRDK